MSTRNRRPRHGHSLGGWLVGLACTVLLVGIVSAQPELPSSHLPPVPVTINCNAGKNINQALQLRPLVRVIRFTGECTENLVISGSHPITLRGFGSDPTIVGSIVVDGVLGVELEGFTVRDSVGDGILVKNGSAAMISDVDTHDTGADGVEINGSVAELTNVTVEDAGAIGIRAVGSQVYLRGLIEVTGSATVGLGATQSATFETDRPGAVVIANNNGLHGLAIQASSSFVHRHGSLTTNANAVMGINMIAGSSILYDAVDLEASNNGAFGMFVADNTYFGVINPGSSIFRFNDNALGGPFALSGGIMIFPPAPGGTEVKRNGSVGIVVNNATGFINDVTVTDNLEADIFLLFSARVQFLGGNVIGGPIVCDGFVETRGDSECEIDLDDLSPEGPKRAELGREILAVGLRYAHQGF